MARRSLAWGFTLSHLVTPSRSSSTDNPRSNDQSDLQGTFFILPELGVFLISTNLTRMRDMEVGGNLEIIFMLEYHYLDTY